MRRVEARDLKVLTSLRVKKTEEPRKCLMKEKVKIKDVFNYYTLSKTVKSEKTEF